MENILNIPENLDWDLLRTFNISSKSKSFSEAARKADIKTSSLIAQMKKLEVFLGVELFKRIRGTMLNHLTPDGYTLLKTAERADNAIRQEVKKEQRNRKIKIYTTNGIASTILPKILIPFCVKFPDIDIYISTQTIPNFLTTDDVVIKVDFFNQENVVKTKLIDINFNFYASIGYIEKYGYPDNVENIGEHRFIFSLDGRDFYRVSSNSSQPNKNIVSSNTDLSYTMCLNDQGIMELPSTYPGVNKLVRVFKDKPGTKHTIYLYYIEKHHENSDVYLFIGMAKNIIKDSTIPSVTMDHTN